MHIDLTGVTEREVHDIKKLTGIDTSEYKRSMDGNAVEHIEKDHGENGVSDHSMSDVEDLARIEYVLDNYDDIEKGTADKVYTKYMNSDNTPAAKVIYSKRVNGNYYVVEAVPDSKAKTLRVISAYKEKAEGVSQVLNMSEDPQLTSQAPHAFAPSDNNISQKKSYVNAVPATIDGQSVTINGIDRIEKDGNRAQMYVKTQDGGSVALSDVRFDSRETEALYNVAQGFDSTDTARAFISGYKQGDSASEYMNAFLDFRRAGQLGQDFDSVLQSNANKYAGLEESQLRQAYYAGVNEKNNAPKHYSAKEEKRAEKNGGLLRNYTKKLNSEQAGSVYVLEALAKKYGFVVEVCDTLADGMANGEYDPKTGRMRMEEIEGSEQILDADLVLIAAGFLGAQAYVTDAFGVETTPRTNVSTKIGHYSTSVEKVFTAGDMHRGQSLVVWAIREGREAAKEVDQYLMGYTNLN